MPLLNIRGILVDFPFEPYDCQMVYMEKVIQSLQEEKNALLESPTGNFFVCLGRPWCTCMISESLTSNQGQEKPCAFSAQCLVGDAN